MQPAKKRLTVTVDPHLVEAANRAVEAGDAESLSGWVSSAMSEKAQRDEKLALLRAAVAAYEAEFGEITAAEIAAVRRTDRSEAIVVRTRSTPRGSPHRPAKPKSA